MRKHLGTLVFSKKQCAIRYLLINSTKLLDAYMFLQPNDEMETRQIFNWMMEKILLINGSLYYTYY